MKRFLGIFFSLLITLSFSSNLIAQDKNEKGYEFTPVVTVKATAVKSQARSNTCWSFATVSFLESEILRMGNGEIDLSEIYYPRLCYLPKAKNYVRQHGLTVFGEGGQAHDVLNVMKNFGIVPEEVYNGMKIGENKHKHYEMFTVLKGIAKSIVANKNRRISPVWPQVINATLDAYLGELPKSFVYKGKQYTPLSFMKKVGLNPDNYVELTSYLHHPFYKTFSLEVPDNWSHDLYYNIPVNDLIDVIDHALKNGYSIAWDADVSEKEFNQKKGVAILPEKAWEDKNKEEQDSTYNGKEKELKVTQEYRQKTFDNYETTDDHLMHIVGIAKDQNGKKFYYVKNSWGINSWKYKYNGYIYVSEAFVAAKTIALMVNKNSIPKKIKKKLGL